MTGTLFLRNVRPYAGDATDLLIEDGRIARIALGSTRRPVQPSRRAKVRSCCWASSRHTPISIRRCGACPGTRTKSARVLSRIDNERLNSRQLGIEPARQSARQCIQSSLMGTTYVRGHVDVDTDHGLRGHRRRDAHTRQLPRRRRHRDENARCTAFDLPDRRNVFPPATQPSTAHSTSAVI